MKLGKHSVLISLAMTDTHQYIITVSVAELLAMLKRVLFSPA